MSLDVVRCSVCNQESEPGTSCKVCHQPLKPAEVAVKRGSFIGQRDGMKCAQCGSMVALPPNCLRCGFYNKTKEVTGKSPTQITKEIQNEPPKRIRTSVDEQRRSFEERRRKESDEGAKRESPRNKEEEKSDRASPRKNESNSPRKTENTSPRKNESNSPRKNDRVSPEKIERISPEKDLNDDVEKKKRIEKLKQFKEKKDAEKRKKEEEKRAKEDQEKEKIESVEVERSEHSNGVFLSLEKTPLEGLFEKMELDDLLVAILKQEQARRFFSSVEVIKKLLWYLFLPNTENKDAGEVPEQEDAGMTQGKIKVYCAEILTNPDSWIVFSTIVSNGELMEYFFSPWKTGVLDSSIIRLFDYLMQHRYHAFVRQVQLLDYVIPSMVKHLHMPEVRTLIHAMIANESVLCNHMPELFWSRESVIPLVCERFKRAVKNPSDSVELTMMCEFVGELLKFHYLSSPHIIAEIVTVFDIVCENVLQPDSNYEQEFLDLFFEFFPKRIPSSEPALQLTLCKLADTEDWADQQSRDIYYHEQVESFLASKAFQRKLRNALSKSSNGKLTMFRWRAIQIVCRIVFMASSELDESLIISGNLQRVLELFFEFHTSSMLHSLILEMLEFMMLRSSEATIYWTFVEFGMIKKALEVCLELKGDKRDEKNKNVQFFGHLLKFFVSLKSSSDLPDRFEVLEEALCSSLELKQKWDAFKTRSIPRILAEQKYEIAAEKVERSGSILERIAAAEQEEDNMSAAKKIEKKAEEYEEVVEIIEEVIEEEVVEEVVEEVIEEVIEEEVEEQKPQQTTNSNEHDQEEIIEIIEEIVEE